MLVWVYKNLVGLEISRMNRIWGALGRGNLGLIV